VAHQLRRLGWTAWALRGGSAAWRAAGYPVESKAAEEAGPADETCPTCGQPAAAHR
jgi:3-mercaptopyruvate sulfurtransferase SseA